MPSAGTPARKWTSSRWLRLGPLLVAALLAAYAALGYWAAPRIVRALAVDYVDTELHKTLSMGEVRVDPFRLRLAVDDLRIADGKASLVALRKLELDVSTATLWRRGYVLDAIVLEGPDVQAVVGADGTLNLSGLLPADDGAPDAPPPAVYIRRLEVADGRIDFIDHSRAGSPRLRLSPISFLLEDFSSSVEGGRFRLAAVSGRGERFEWAGGLSLQPLASEGAVVVEGLDADTVQDFLDELLPLRMGGGAIDLSATYGFSAAPGDGVRFDATVPMVRARDLALRARGVDEDWIVLPEATVEAVRLSYPARSVSIETVQMQGARLSLWREPDGSLNLARLLGEPASGSPSVPADDAGTGATTTADTSDADAWTLAVGSVRFDAERVDIEDRSVTPAAAFQLAPLAAVAEGISLEPDAPVTVRLDATVNGAAPLSVAGSVVPGSLGASLEVELSGLPLHDVEPYLPELPRLRIGAGTVGGSGTLALHSAGETGPALEFSGQGAIAGFRLLDAVGGDPLLSWQGASAEGLRYTMAPDALSIRTLRLQAPATRVAVRPDGTINLVDAFGGGVTVAPAPAPGPAGMPLSIARVEVSDGQLGFSDLSIEPSFSADIDALRGTVTGVSNARGQVAKIDLRGHVVSRHSPVEISGESDLLAYDRHTDVRMGFRNIELPIFNPYSGRFAGYAIAKGKLATELHYRIEERALVADHHVVVDQLEWGDATDSKDKVTLPVRLATALLKDRHGVIDLELPVTGSIDDPEFRVGPVVWQIIKNIITRAVTAPFALLGSLFQGAEDAQYVDFAPGSAEPGERSAAGLAALSAALAEKTELKLDIPAAMAAGNLDADAIAARRLRDALAAEAGVAADAFDPELLESGERLDLLEALYRAQFGHRPEVPEAPETAGADAEAEADAGSSRSERREAARLHEIAWLQDQLLPRYAPAAGELEALGTARAAAVQDALLADGSIDPARLFLALDLAAGEHEGAARMELQLK